MPASFLADIGIAPKRVKVVRLDPPSGKKQLYELVKMKNYYNALMLNMSINAF